MNKWMMAIAALGGSVGTTTYGAVLINAINVAVTQNFDTLGSAATNNTALPVGWAFAETGSSADVTYRGGSGSSATGDTWSFGATSGERAFGTIQSNTLVAAIGAAFTNNAGVAITSLNIQYDGETWRHGNTLRGYADELHFEYSTNATSLTDGTWTSVSALNFVGVAPVATDAAGARDGNANAKSISGTISSLSIANGATFWIRWIDVNMPSVEGSSADDGLAIDNFSLTAVPEPGVLGLACAGLLTLRRKRR